MKEHAAVEIEGVLQAIEQEEHVKILFGCESGSRAWGFASTDSDWDVRFIFVHSLEAYVSLDDPAGQLERHAESPQGLLDVVGWDLRKALGLLRKSNPALIEWVRSPIRYREEQPFSSELRALVDRSFSPKPSSFHYGNIARTNFHDFLQADEVKLKRYFYVLRAVLAFEWATSGRGIPPLPFEELLNALIPPSSPVHTEMTELLRMKRAGSELGVGPRLPAVHAYIADAVDAIDVHLQSLARERLSPEGLPSVDELNSFFRRVVGVPMDI